jgi:hypothetical protein
MMQQNHHIRFGVFRVRQNLTAVAVTDTYPTNSMGQKRLEGKGEESGQLK